MEPEHPEDDRWVELSDDEPVLPEITRDETDIGWGERASSTSDDWLHEQRPPHWE